MLQQYLKKIKNKIKVARHDKGEVATTFWSHRRAQKNLASSANTS